MVKTTIVLLAVDQFTTFDSLLCYMLNLRKLVQLLTALATLIQA